MKNTTDREVSKTTITLIYSTDSADSGMNNSGTYSWKVKSIGKSVSQEEYIQLLNGIDSEIVLLVDGGRMSLSAVNGVIQNYNKDRNAGKNV